MFFVIYIVFGTLRRLHVVGSVVASAGICIYIVFPHENAKKILYYTKTFFVGKFLFSFFCWARPILKAHLWPFQMRTMPLRSNCLPPATPPASSPRQPEGGIGPRARCFRSFARQLRCALRVASFVNVFVIYIYNMSFQKSKKKKIAGLYMDYRLHIGCADLRIVYQKMRKYTF